MPRWTDEQRKAQSERIKDLKPWLKTTGPKTEQGKRNSSQNAIKHGLRSQLAKDVKAVLRQQEAILRDLSCHPERAERSEVSHLDLNEMSRLRST